MSGATWEAQLGHKLLLDKVVSTSSINKEEERVADNVAHQAESFQCDMVRQRIEGNLGWVQICGIGWVRGWCIGWVRYNYIRRGWVWVVIICHDEEKNPKGTMVTSVVFLLADEAETSFLVRRNLL